MSFKTYTEAEIRKKILSKVKPTITHKKGPHWKGKIIVDNILVGMVKVPNPHHNSFTGKKLKFLSESLHLTPSQFNDLIDCPLKSKAYYQLFRDEGISIKYILSGDCSNLSDLELISPYSFTIVDSKQWAGGGKIIMSVKFSPQEESSEIIDHFRTLLEESGYDVTDAQVN